MQPKNLSRSIRAIFRLCRIGRRSIIIPDIGNTTAIRMLMHVVGMSIMDNCLFEAIPRIYLSGYLGRAALSTAVANVSHSNLSLA
jgi:hypothetical protein